MTNTRFGQFCDAYFPTIDGVVQTVHNYAFWLSKKYSKAVVVAPESPDYVDDDIFEVIRYRSIDFRKFPSYRIGLPQFDLEFKKQINNIPFSLLHTHSPFINGRLALKIARQQGVPVISTFHTKYREDISRMVKLESITDATIKFIVKYYHEVDRVWVPSESTGKTLKDYGYQGTYTIMPNGCDLNIPLTGEYDEYRKAGREMTGTVGTRMLFLFVGQHRWVKNIRLIIQALGILKRTGADFQMLFVGIGADSEEIRKTAEAEGILQNTSFFGFVDNRETLKHIYAAADLFLFPSLYDNMPLVVREAAAFQVPAVLIDGSAPAEGLQDNTDCFLIRNDASDMAAKLMAIMDKPELIRSVGVRAQRSIYISWEQIIDKVYKEYQEVIRTHESTVRESNFIDDTPSMKSMRFLKKYHR